MTGLTTTLLGRACWTFLTLAYPGGIATVPAPRRIFANIPPDTDLTALLIPPICEALRTPEGSIKGYALRLGSASYPHLKLRIDSRDDGATCVFSVDTHDALLLEPGHPDAPGWARLKMANRELKEAIEQAWDGQGLLTFNGLLRQGLDRIA
jgi:hypothetical protein